MPHSTYQQVNEVLRIADATELNNGSTSIMAKIVDADILIDERLTPYGLSVAGTSSPTITTASKYMAACLFIEDFSIQRGEEKDLRARMWRENATHYIDAYIETHAQTRKDSDGGYGRVRHLYSTTISNP